MMRLSLKSAIMSLALFVYAVPLGDAVAQEAEQASQVAATNDAQAKPEVPKEVVFVVDQFPSLLFTYWEQVALEDARNSRGLTRAPSRFEVDSALTEVPLQIEKPPPEARYIRLNGIVYKDNKDWIVWLNEKRVTPDALPKEALDLKVYKEYIEIKWFDEYTNNIFPIRLRPHQRFNIDTRIFLPG